MRTTVTIDEHLLAQLKQRAADSGTSVSRVVEQAARLFMRESATGNESGPVELVTFGAGGRFSRRNIDKTSALLEIDDLERFRDGG